MKQQNSCARCHLRHFCWQKTSKNARNNAVRCEQQKKQTTNETNRAHVSNGLRSINRNFGPLDRINLILCEDWARPLVTICV